MNHIAAFILASLLAGAATASNAAGVAPALTANPKDLPVLNPQGILVLRRTGCFGVCPIYQVEVDRDGAVRYEGRANVVNVGSRSGRLTAEDLKLIQEVIARINTIGNVVNRECPKWHTDASFVILALRQATKVRRVRDYLGCEGMKNPGDDRDLRELRQLENRIDSILGTEKWIGTVEERRAAERAERDKEHSR